MQGIGIDAMLTRRSLKQKIIGSKVIIAMVGFVVFGTIANVLSIGLWYSWAGVESFPKLFVGLSGVLAAFCLLVVVIFAYDGFSSEVQGAPISQEDDDLLATAFDMIAVSLPAMTGEEGNKLFAHLASMKKKADAKKKKARV